MDYKNSNLSVEQRIDDLLARMTLEEKVAQLDMCLATDFATKPSKKHICSIDEDSAFDYEKLKNRLAGRGIGSMTSVYTVPAVTNRLQRYFVEETRLGIPCLFTGEGLHGIDGLRGTVFPSCLAMAATFNPDLVYRIGDAIGKETRSLGIHEVLSPNLDIARELRWGRVEETFGEDTYLASRLGVSIIKGLQKGDISRPDSVVSEPKHYCVYGIPEGGSNCSPAHVGHREVKSVYLPVFEAGIKEGGAYNVMASYNSVDGDVMMCSNNYLDKILKQELGLKGYSRSDWGGIGKIKGRHHLVTEDSEAIRMAIGNGLDVQGLDYPNDIFEPTLVDLVNNDAIPMSRIDDAVSRVLRVKFDLGLFDKPYCNEDNYVNWIRCEEHRFISLNTARESITLLKNNGVLPLDKSVKSIALIGPNSASPKIGGYSSIPTGYTVASVLDVLKSSVGEDVTIRQCNGCSITEGEKTEHIIDGHPHLYSEGEDEILNTLDEAVMIASECDVIIMVGGDNSLTSGECHDRTELTLPGKQRELIQKLSKLNKPLHLVLLNGKAFDLSLESQLCDSIMMAWFGGEHGSQAIVEALLGELNPSGRLPISFPQSSGRIPCYYSMLPGGDFGFFEGTKGPMYPFGYGLSYTTFDYSNLQVSTIDPNTFEGTVTIDITNTGDTSGDEVIQLYVNDLQSSIVTPMKLLKGFKRIHLAPHACKTITFELNFDTFKLMDLDCQWVVEPGDFKIMIGAASNDIRCESIITL